MPTTHFTHLPIHLPPPSVLRLPIKPDASIHVDKDADGNLVRAHGTTTDGHKLELVITGDAPDQTATFTENGVEFLAISTAFQPLGIKDPADPAWSNRRLYLLDARSHTCWIRCELIPGPMYSSDSLQRPFAVSRSVPDGSTWRVVDAASGTFDSKTHMFRLSRINPVAFSGNPADALVAVHLPGAVPDLTAETNLTAELAKANYFSTVFHPTVVLFDLTLRNKRALLLHSLAWCLGGAIAGSSGGAWGLGLGCLGGVIASTIADATDLALGQANQSPGSGTTGTGAPSASGTGGSNPNEPPKKTVKTEHP